MHAQTRFTGQPTNGRGMFQIRVFFLFGPGCFSGLLRQLSTNTLLLGSGLPIFFFGGFRGGWLCRLGGRLGGRLFLGVGELRSKQRHEDQQRNHQQGAEESRNPQPASP